MNKKYIEDYNIETFSLQNKIYYYQFEIDDDFFSEFEHSIVQKGNCKINLTLQKSEIMLQLYFDIAGKVQLTCDRSLELFDFPIEVNNERFILKYGEKDEDFDDEIAIITPNTSHINLAQYIYEFVTLQIPIKKLHPRFWEEEDEQDSKENVFIYSTHADEAEDTKENLESEKQLDNIDPRWAKLKHLKDKN